MNKPLQIFVPRLMDADNNNPQNLNAKALLSRFVKKSCTWMTTHYNHPMAFSDKKNIHLIRLLRWRFWYWHLLLIYQKKMDAIFYPGIENKENLAWRFRSWCYRKVPMIATMEGFCGDHEREQQFSQWAGHQVYCQRVSKKILAKVDELYYRSNHIIAISPFIAKLGRQMYGDKFSVLPLGVDLELFFESENKIHSRFTVISAGRLYENKQPALFLALAERYPVADFIWFGDGELRGALLKEKHDRNIKNVNFPGAVTNSMLAEEFRKANLFVLPSLSEGVPKVTQEAAACGLPVIVFGFYEHPFVIDGVNGYVVWNNEQLFSRVGELINNPSHTRVMGSKAAEIVKQWSWDVVAPQWEKEIISILQNQY